jgi:cytochrome subunit of sulfide dehydrogenase
MKASLALVLLLLAAAAPPPGATGCSGCHGKEAPIAGHNASELTAKLLAFRSGQRQSTVMQRIAKGFDAAELTAIAAWWATQK